MLSSASSASVAPAGAHGCVLRRGGVNMMYIVENNGVYGLTKGQFSATRTRAARANAAR